jgi:phosphoribosylformylglycinamidine synthase
VTARVGVVLFPGSNCEQDVVRAVEHLGGDAEILWHGDATTHGVDAVVVPGGFAHGDYLRTGAIARFSPVTEAVGAFAAAGGPVVGICNGFQILTEAGLLPGALQKNAGLKFLCRPVDLRVETATTVLTNAVTPGTVLRIPINHFEGNYVCDANTLAELRAEERVVVRYVDNPNGSLDDIAGICNAGRNVVGLMPHPERASDEILGSADGVGLLRSLLAAAAGVAA